MRLLDSLGQSNQIYKMKYFSVAIFFIALAYASSAQFGFEGYGMNENEDLFNDIMGMHWALRMFSILF